jgi:hypothetical protein
MASNDSPSVGSRIGRLLRAICWTISILASAGAGAFVYLHLGAARGPGQQVAVAALGLVAVLVPYTIAQGVTKLTS